MPPVKKGYVGRAPFPVNFVQQVAAGSLLTSISLFSNPSGAAAAGGGEYYEIVEISAWWDVVSTSGTIDIRNVPTATAATGGATVLSATFNTGATARAVQKAALVTNRNTLRLLPGNVLTMILAGTLTGLVGCSVTVWLQAMRNIRSR